MVEVSDYLRPLMLKDLRVQVSAHPRASDAP